MEPFTGSSDSTTGTHNLQPLEGVLADLAPQVTSTAAGDQALPEDNLAGSKCEVVTFYNHGLSERSPRWSEFRDQLAEERRLKELGKDFPIIHRKSRVESGGGGDSGQQVVTWVTSSIEAQSPRLRAVLDALFSEYPSWYSDESPYAVGPPFKPYVHRWQQFLDACGQSYPDAETADELQLLRRELESRIEEQLSALERVRTTGVVAFEDLWLILNPGCLVVSGLGRDTTAHRAYKLIQTSYIPATSKTKARYEIMLTFTEWNGACCGITAEEVRVTSYKNAIAVTRLPVCPVELVPRWDEMEDRLLIRGRKFESLRGYHIKVSHGKKYTFRTNPLTGCPEEVEKPMSGRIVVDAFAYYKVQSKVAPALVPLVDARRGLSNLSTAAAPRGSSSRKPTTGLRSDWEKFLASVSDSDSLSSPESDAHSETPLGADGTTTINTATTSHGAERNNERIEDLMPLTDLECVIASPRVRGFDLATKEWYEFDVESLRDVVWDCSPYDNLVLPEGEKDLVFAFANRPRHSTQGFDDFVAHKGEGIIILLCGPPGVGKTLTAEAVAEKSRVPLYIVSASDLGTSPEKVEQGLLKALECCQIWDAVLLIDEADVFLESRDSSNLERNELVSIFLRRLEYYRGLMFLTTNRVESIDSAFKSRIDLILPYYDLDVAARRRVWVNFVQALNSGVAELADADFDAVAAAPLNGREIKNTIKTSLMLASAEVLPLRLKHIKVVLGIRQRVREMERQQGPGGRQEQQHLQSPAVTKEVVAP